MNNKKNFIKVAVVLFAIISLNSCATKKKYGCPNHIVERLIDMIN